MQSMTGMGRAKGEVDGAQISVEIKSVNHRYCEVNTRLPSKLQSLEILISQLIKKKISRGKVDIWIGEDKVDNEISLNKNALKKYHQFLTRVCDEIGIVNDIQLSHLQEGASFWMNQDLDAEKLWPKLKPLIEKAISQLIKMRSTEGKTIQKQLLSRISKLEKLTVKVEKRKSKVLQEYKKKLNMRIEKLLDKVEVDQSKLANEIAFFADKADVTEELERLSGHFSHMKKIMGQTKPIGRPLDFLIQEMNREWNTLSSKTSDVSIAHDVVNAKSELEKIREQVQNIE